MFFLKFLYYNRFSYGFSDFLWFPKFCPVTIQWPAGPGPGTSPGNGQNAVANTGGGGGGGSRGAPGTNAGQTGGNGGKGIVIIRYKFQ